MHDGASARAFVHVAVATARRRAGDVAGRHAGPDADRRARVGDALPPAPAGASPPCAPRPTQARRRAAARRVRDASQTRDLGRGAQRDHDPHLGRQRRAACPRGATELDLVGDLAFDRDAPGAAPGGSGPAATCCSRRSRGADDRGSPADADPAPPPGGAARRAPSARGPAARHRADARRVGRARTRCASRLCVAVDGRDGDSTASSVARGNLVLADHGRDGRRVAPGRPGWRPAASGAAGARDRRRRARPFRFRLARGPARAGGVPPPSSRGSAGPQRSTPRPTRAPRCRRWRSSCGARRRLAAASWRPAPATCSRATRFDQAFAVEIGRTTAAPTLRFGDDRLRRWRRPTARSSEATYRVGVGSGGQHRRRGARARARPAADRRRRPIEAVRNPLPAAGGSDPEPIERVKRLAPAAFRAVQQRAVTEADYARVAERHRRRSSARVRDLPLDRELAHRLPHRRPARARPVDDRPARGVLEPRRALHAGRLRPRARSRRVYVAARHRDARLRRARALPRRTWSRPCSSALGLDGPAGFFHPDRFTFGQPLYLSALYAAVEAVDGRGLRHARGASRALTDDDPAPGRPVTAAQRRPRADRRRAGSRSCALDNDPSRPENGVAPAADGRRQVSARCSTAAAASPRAGRRPSSVDNRPGLPRDRLPDRHLRHVPRRR